MPDIMSTEPLGKTAGVCLIILGLCALLFPQVIFPILDIFLAALAFIIGIGFIREGLSRKNENALNRFLLMVAGILGVGIGIYVLVARWMFMFTLKDIIGIWAIITGIGYIIYVFTTVVGFDRGFKAVAGVALVLLGGLLLIAPVLLTDDILVIALGLFAIVLGILTIIFACEKPKPKKEINHLIYK
jgi:uncharacterized membrane protein HdeD (DUF308 family)